MTITSFISERKSTKMQSKSTTLLVTLILTALVVKSAPVSSQKDWFFLSFLKTVSGKVEVPKEVVSWTQSMKREIPHFGTLEFGSFFDNILKPPWDVHQDDLDKCDLFLTDVLEASGFQVDEVGQAKFTTQQFDDEDSAAIARSTEDLKDHIKACLIQWGMRDGTIKLQRPAADPRLALTGIEPRGGPI